MLELVTGRRRRGFLCPSPRLSYFESMRRTSRVLVGILFLIVLSSIYGRRWTTAAGQAFEGDFVRVDGANAVISSGGKEYQYPIAALSVPDRLFVNRTAYAQRQGGPTTAPNAAPTLATPAPPPAKPSGLQVAGHAITIGSQNEIEIPITDTMALKTVKDSYKKPSTKARMLLVLPNDFDPTGKGCPLLVVSATTDGGGSSVGSGKANNLPDAISKGFAVMAVDGEFGRPDGEGDSTEFRWALTASGLSAINKEWPKSKTWPIVSAGVSGGGGYASHQAMMLIQKQAPVIGLLLAVTGWDPTDFPDVLQRTPFTPLHNLPIFISAGESDSIATKEVTDKMHQDVTGKGFRKVRFEHFAGGHELNRQHLQTALAWFLEENDKSRGTTRK